MAALARPTLGTLVTRALLLRCPRCGGRGIWRSWFRMKHACPTCGQVFERGESHDFFIGAYLINLVVAESTAIVVAAVMWVGVGLRGAVNGLWGAAVVVAVVMPVVFFPLSRGLLLGFGLQ